MNMTRKKQTDQTKPSIKDEPETIEVEPVVTSEAEEIPTSPTEIPTEEAPKPEDNLVIISNLPTKNVKKASKLTPDAQSVRIWYTTLSAGQTFTKKTAAKELGITEEELTGYLAQIAKTVLPRHRGHITDWK